MWIYKIFKGFTVELDDKKTMTIININMEPLWLDDKLHESYI